MTGQTLFLVAKESTAAVGKNARRAISQREYVAHQPIKYIKMLMR
jgi:hypothetical protein